MIALALACGIALVLSLVLTPLSRRLGIRLGSSTGRAAAGGTTAWYRVWVRALYLSFVIAVLAVTRLPAGIQPPRLDPNEPVRLAGLLIGATLVFLLGLADDVLDLNPRIQLIGQIAVAALALPYLIMIQIVQNPLTNQPAILPYGVVVVLTIFWIAGMINTVNFLDGVDGLAAGVTAIMCAFLALHMLREGQFSVALLPLALLGSVIGFLPFNFFPARTFMGSTGAFFLGYAVGALSIMGGAKMATVLLIMGIPIMDVAWQIFARLRAHRSPGAGDRGHLHHRLQDLGLSPRQIVGIYLFCILFGVLALVISKRLYKLGALAGLAALTLVVLIVLSRLEPKTAA